MFSDLEGMILCFGLLTHSILIHQCSGERTPIVSTKMGKLRGRRNVVLGHVVDSFLGIPYAEPPVGDLRFKRPQPIHTPWTGVRDATSYGFTCWQVADLFSLNFTAIHAWTPKEPMSEDCLHLNIWRPNLRHRNLTAMVWIHGGSLLWGGASIDMYNGSILAAKERVIVVTINYRLGPLGFLALNTSDAPGNMGLMDQVLALEWVHQNIADFGGDPNKITLVGQSAGSASVAYHMHSSLSKDKFQRAILQSGTTNVAGLDPMPRNNIRYYGIMLAADLGCVISDTTSQTDKHTQSTHSYDSNGGGNDGGGSAILSDLEIVECLRGKDPVQIAANVWTFGIHFPVVDGVFIENDFETHTIGDNYKPTDVLIGVNENEAVVNMIRLPRFFFPNSENLLNYMSFENFVRQLLETTEKNHYIADSAAFMYTDWYDQHNPHTLRDAFEDMVGDYTIKCPTIEFARQYSSSPEATVFMYHFTHRKSTSTWPPWMGCVHGDEVEFVFGAPLRKDSTYTAEEIALSEKVMHYWANFAKTGSPNGDCHSKGCHGDLWSPFNNDTMAFKTLNLSTLQPSIPERGLRVPYCDFWRELWPKLKQSTHVNDNTHSDPCPAAVTSSTSLHKITMATILTYVILLLFITEVCLLVKING